ncbi:MAG TPA: glutathione S-transferase family protein [Verrucomicrobiae bacterium]|nr:glutathione S-transferase family protein [Verrucomicrobiae bacterium]
MFLIGQYDSPFVRRVGIALMLYKLPFEHRPWSSFGEADKIRQYNPLTRVPTLVLDNGEALIDSHIILDYLDSLMPAEARMFPVAEPARHQALKVATLATGLGDMAVSLFYETKLHTAASEVLVKRRSLQIASVLKALEADCGGRRTDYWFGAQIGHADIAIAAVLRFISEVHAGLISLADFPALKAHAARLEALPAFQQIQQPFIPPA